MPLRELRLTPEDIYGEPVADGTYADIDGTDVRRFVKTRLLVAGFNLQASIQRRREDEAMVYTQTYAEPVALTSHTFAAASYIAIPQAVPPSFIVSSLVTHPRRDAPVTHVLPVAPRQPARRRYAVLVAPKE